MNSNDPKFWEMVIDDCGGEFGGKCLICFACTIGPKTVEFCHKNSIPLGTCIQCMSKRHKSGKPASVNPMDVFQIGFEGFSL